MFESIPRALTVLGLAAALSFALPAQGEAQDAPALTVSSVSMGTALERGRPTEPKVSFAQSEGRLYVVVQLQNPSGAETQVRVLIRQAGGSNRAGINLDVPARRRYRTVARFNTRQPPGSYEAVVLNAAGEEISATAFTITP